MATAAQRYQSMYEEASSKIKELGAKIDEYKRSHSDWRPEDRRYRSQGRWLYKPYPSELADLERQQKAWNERQGQASRELSQAEKIGLKKEEKRESLRDLKELRREASLGGEGSKQEIDYLRARAGHEKSYGSLGDYTPINFKGGSQVPTVRYSKSYVYKESFDQDLFKESVRDYLLQKQQVYKSRSDFDAAIASGEIRESRPGEISAAPYRYVSDKPRSVDKFDEFDMLKGPSFRTDLIIEKQEKQGFMGKYQKVEDWVSTKISIPASRWLGDRTGLSSAGIGEKFADYGFLWKGDNKRGLFKQPESYRKFKAGMVTGFLREYRDRPVKAAASTAVFFALPGVLQGVGKAGGWFARTTRLSVVGEKVASIPGYGYASKMVAGTFKYGVPIAYGSSVVYRSVKAGDAYGRGSVFGSIVAGEIIPMAAGGFAGSKVWPKVYGRLATIGRKKVEVESIVPKDVMLGSTKFPSAPVKSHLSLFRQQEYALPGRIERFTGSRYSAGSWQNVNQANWGFKYLRPSAMGYHATASYLSPTVQRGASELEGLYMSYGTSPHFLRLNSGTKYYGANLFEPYGSPKVAAIVPTRFSYGKTVRLGRAYRWAGESQELGVGLVPGIKTEVEAILLPGTRLSKISGSRKYFFEWNKVRVPIDQYEVAKSGEFLITKSGSFSRGSRGLYSYRLPSSYPVSSPATFGFALVSSVPKSSSSFRLPSSVAVGSYDVISGSRYNLSSRVVSSSVYSYGSSSGFSAVSSIRSMRSSVSVVSSVKESSISNPSSYPKSSFGSSSMFSVIGSSGVSLPLGKVKSGKMKVGGKKDFEFDSVFNPKYFSDVTSAAFNIKGGRPSQFQIAAGGARPILRM